MRPVASEWRGGTPVAWGRRGRGDAGSATILVLGVALVVLAAGLATALLASAVAARHTAQATADLAAVAAASRIGIDDSSCAVASDIADRNGAVLQQCTIDRAADDRSGTVDIAVSMALGGPVPGWTATGRARAARLSAQERVRDGSVGG